ncbi:MAG: hypothetical protein HC819_11455 [Cyclobacteriaceae bacterium]|nr:hypothetical protein [Cyclobacteriaceae bacterium]
MNKVRPRHIQGYTYLHLSDLPFDQMVHFKEWIVETDILKLRSNTKTLENCVLYDQYDFWFEHIRGESHHFEHSGF